MSNNWTSDDYGYCPGWICPSVHRTGDHCSKPRGHDRHHTSVKVMEFEGRLTRCFRDWGKDTIGGIGLDDADD